MEKHRENKPHIGFFGRCNVGKSSLINHLVGQDIAIVSKQRGTTTDIVKKTMELHGLGAVVLIDTAGLDDNSPLGEKRKEKTREVFSLIDLCIIVISGNTFGDIEQELINRCKQLSMPYLIVHNKEDEQALDCSLLPEKEVITISQYHEDAKEKLSKAIADKLKGNKQKTSILSGIVGKNDLVILVTPIDSSAPEGRMILPQVKMIREVLDNDAINLVVKPQELEYLLSNLNGLKPKLVITDSQAFDYVNSVVSEDIYLTSFSILLAKEKGNFDKYLQGTKTLDNLRDGDKVLMLESCTHQPTCEDIGRVKLPKMISKYTGKNLSFHAIAGLTNTTYQPEDFALVIQCGGCVATERQLFNRLQPFVEKHIPVSNYGMTIAYINGIFERATKIFTLEK